MALDKQKIAAIIKIEQIVDGIIFVNPSLIFRKYPLAIMPKNTAAVK
tara:strand:- start:546 stop:686 length:141 start_codon:yes stop_codon:yes gene_type:complete